MKKVLAFVGIAVLMTSVAAAEINPNGHKATDEITVPATRQNGTMGSLTISAVQTGALQVRVDASVTTVGGDGVPFYGATVTLNDQIWLYAQIYDAPWVDGCTSWATPGVNWCGHDEGFFINSPTPLNNFAVSFTATVPAAQDYQLFALAYAALSWPGTTYQSANRSQTSVMGPVGTIYIDSTQPPTPTPPPGGFGGEPIPTLNWLGILAMIAILGGIAVLVMNRK